MNILVVSPWLPYPETWGSAIRLANTVRGLSRLGEIDLFVIEEQRPDRVPDLPPAWHVRRVNVVVAPPRRISPMQRLRWLVRGPLPRRFLGLDYTDIRAAFERWRAKTYDLAWMYQVECPIILRGLLPSRAVVDINDLQDYKIAARLKMDHLAAQQERRAPSEQLRRAAARLLDRRDQPLWRALQARVARAADAVVLCSELDRQRIGVSNAHVIVNGYQEQAQPLGRAVVGDPPTVVCVGLFDYAPNVDAAAFLVNEILPELRSRIPSVRVRLVGHASKQVRELEHPPEVVVTGFVPEIAPELAAADLIVIPVRYGGGTRIKILEAFAHRIPVVSTTLGAEGIEAARGQEIMVEDSPAGFAQACAALLTDIELRRSVTDAAHRLFLARYRSSRVEDAVEGLAAQVVGGRAGRATGNRAGHAGQ